MKFKSFFGIFLCLIAITIGTVPSASAALACPTGIAHRGNAYYGSPSENSINAFNASFSAGAQWIESDVHFTSDSVPVIMHNATVDEATDGTGAIANMTAAQFTSLHLSDGQHPPTLDQLLDLIKASSSRRLLLEIKASSASITTAREQILLQKLSGLEPQVQVFSFQDRFATVQRLKAANPALTISILGYDPILPAPAGIVSEDLEYTYVTAARVSQLHSLGLKVTAWTANNATAWQNLRQMGVDAIITNKVKDYLAWAKTTCPADPTPTAPTVSMTMPAPGSELSGIKTIGANANDAVSISSVQFQLNGNNLGDADTSAPYSLDWDTTTVADGTYNLRAVATNNSGLQTTSAPISVAVNNAPAPPAAPTVAINTPTTGSTVSGTHSVVANADDESGISSVQFQLDGADLGQTVTNAPYTHDWDTTTVPDGTHTLRAVATNTLGVQAVSNPVTVTVDNIVDPPTTKEFVTNKSFETDTTGWTGSWSANSRNTRVSGGYNGSYSLRSVNNSSATAQNGFSGKPLVIDGITNATVSGKAYTGNVWVKPDVAGQKINLYLRETNAAGTTVGSRTVTLTTRTTAWQEITNIYNAVGTGNRLNITVYVANAAPNQGFNTDLISLTALN